MSLPGNGLLVVSSEAALLATALRGSTHWGSRSFPTEEYYVLMRMFRDLQALLASVDDLRLLDPTTYLAPFLELVRSKETTGPVTSLALSAINKFLAYGLIDPTHGSVPAAVEDIADAVTHARFVGTDPSSDAIVLLKMLQVLRTLMLSPEGTMLTDESVCDIMLSCFRIAFESRLNDLLRRNAEQCLRDMTQLVMMRLPQLGAEAGGATLTPSVLSLKRKERADKRQRNTTQTINTNSLERGATLSAQSSVTAVKESQEKIEASPANVLNSKNQISEAEITIELPKSPSKKHTRHSSMDLASDGNLSISQMIEKCVPYDAESNENDDKKTDSNENIPVDAVCKTEEVNEIENVDTLIENETQGVVDERKDGENNKDLKEIETNERSKEEEEKQNDELNRKEDEVKKVEDYVNMRGIRFTQQEDAVAVLVPYGLTCVRELFRFLISLCNPLDSQNTPAMLHLGLSLTGVVLEIGADHLANYPSLLALVKDPLCRNLLSLLNSDRISLFALDLQISFLLFESLRHHLKLQMESFFKKLIDIISTETTKSSYEMEEYTHLALESLAQMFRIPGLCTEMYLNYDCDVYCSNLFEDLTKLLSKNAVSSSASNNHSLSLEALMTIIDSIESTCNQNKIVQVAKCEEPEVEENKYGRGGYVSLELGGMDDASVVSDHVVHDIKEYLNEVRIGRHVTTSEVPSETEIDLIKKRKKWIAKGTELFNQKPDKGIEYLQQQGVLKDPLDTREVAAFLRENPGLDKKMIGEYICKRSKCGEDGSPSVLAAFADSFDYAGLRIDKALRLYLETFRLPGEAPLIFLVMEHFAERWHTCNGSPLANTDAAFRLAYAVIMLNMDQHNHNAKKLNVPMRAEDFVRNLRGCNGSGDFDPVMLEEIFNAIKSEEIVMPAEHTGLLKENYLWKVLLRRGAQSRYLAAAAGALDERLFDIAWGPTLTALSCAFERAPAPTREEVERGARDCPALRALLGLEQCAGVAGAGRGAAREATIDTLVLTMCKFTGLLSVPENASYISVGVGLGQSRKAQLALVRACAVTQRHADCVRGAWRHVLDILRTLFIARLLPEALTEAEDFLSDSGRVSLIRESSSSRSDSGLLSSIYSYIALGESVAARAPSAAEKAYMEAAAECVAGCGLQAMLGAETKFLQLESLQELMRHLIEVGAPPDADSLQQNPQLEDLVVLYLELVTNITVHNRDRVLSVWPAVSAHMGRVLAWSAGASGYACGRALTALLKAAVRLMRSEHCASSVLDTLRLISALPYRAVYAHADMISCGLYELVKTCAQNVHSAEDWRVLLGLLAGVGGGRWSDTDCEVSSRSEDSEDEGIGVSAGRAVSSDSELSTSPQSHGWIMSDAPDAECRWGTDGAVLRPHRAAALLRCTEALALVVRDVAHVTPYNYAEVVNTVRLLVQASYNAGEAARGAARGERGERRARGRRRRDDSDDESDPDQYHHMVSIQLLDLMHTLHSRTEQIFRWWREEASLNKEGDEEYDLWDIAWIPLLQGIAKLCTDSRKQVWQSAVSYLQRALLAPGLQRVGGAGWERCFRTVLFPLLQSAAPRLAARLNTIVCKVFLQRLSALSGRTAFAALWRRLVELQLRLTAAPAHGDDALREAARESLKNMILVMDSVQIFSGENGYNELWSDTWALISPALPGLQHELFPHLAAAERTVPPPAAPAPPAPLPPAAVPAPPPAPTVRNPLYLPPAPHSSVLLQPLSQLQMVSTPIGVAHPPAPLPLLLPDPRAPSALPHPSPALPHPPLALAHPPAALPHHPVAPDSVDTATNAPSTLQTEIYAEYLTNPYNDAREVSPREVTLYDPTERRLLDQKSLSVDSSPVRQQQVFRSSDNVRFDFTSYFGGCEAPPPGAEMLFGEAMGEQ